MYNNHLSACRRAKNMRLPSTKVVKCPSKLLYGTDMFTFDTYLRFKLTYKYINVRKVSFNFKSPLQFYGKKELDIKVNAIFF